MLYGDNDSASRNAQGQLIGLAQDQFDIGGFRFGGLFDTILLDSFDPGEAAWDTQDQESPFGQNVVFGRDTLRGPEWTLDAFTNGYDVDDSLDAVDNFAKAWRAVELKDQPGAYQILRYRIGNSTRRVYGRSRKFYHLHDPRTYSGTAPISASFRLMSNHYYDDEHRETTMSIVPPSTGGLIAPLIAPLTSFGRGSSRGGVIADVGGSAPAPFHAYFQGPIDRPYLEDSEGRWKIQLNMSLASDQIIHIATHSGMFVVEDNFGRNWAGRLSPMTRINSARLYPGAMTLNFGGSDITGTASASVIWRPTYNTL